jgi:hypothetical protein
MSHNLTFSGLDDFEAEHIASILREYRVKILCEHLTSLANKDEGYVEWYEKHLDWHDEIMKKMKWSEE